LDIVEELKKDIPFFQELWIAVLAVVVALG
jgi:hypothetical protein